MSSDLLAILPPAKRQTAFLFETEKSSNPNQSKFSNLSRKQRFASTLATTKNWGGIQKFDRSISATSENHSEYKMTFSEFVQKAKHDEKMRLSIKPKKKTSGSVSVSNQYSRKRFGSQENLPITNEINFSGFEINENESSLVPFYEFLPPVEQAVEVYQSPKEHKTIDESLLKSPTQKEVLQMLMKIQGHRDLTETFLGDSEKVIKYKNRLVELQKKRLATLERLKKSFQAKIPKVSLKTEDEILEGASLLQVSIASAQQDRFIASQSLMWKNGYQDEHSKKALKDNLAPTPFINHQETKKTKQKFQIGRQSTIRAKSQLNFKSKPKPEVSYQNQFPKDLLFVLQEIQIANLRRPDGVQPIESPQSMLAFAQKLIALRELDAQSDSESLHSPLQKSFDMQKDLKTAFSNTEQMFFDSGLSTPYQLKPINVMHKTQPFLNFSVNGQKSVQEKRPSKSSLSNQTASFYQSKSKRSDSIDTSNKVRLSRRFFNSKKTLKEDANQTTGRTLSKRNLATEKIMESDLEQVLSKNALASQIELKSEPSDEIQISAIKAILEKRKSPKRLGTPPSQTIHNVTNTDYTKRKLNLNYFKLKQKQSFYQKESNQFENLLKCQPITKPESPFDYQRMLKTIEPKSCQLQFVPQQEVAPSYDANLIKIVQNQLSKLDISKEYLIAGREQKKQEKINNEDYWSNFSNSIQKSLIKQAKLDPTVSADSYRNFSVAEGGQYDSVQDDKTTEFSTTTYNMFSKPLKESLEENSERKNYQKVEDPRVEMRKESNDQKQPLMSKTKVKLPQHQSNEILDAIHKDLMSESTSFPELSKIIASKPMKSDKKQIVISNERTPKSIRPKEFGRIRRSSELLSDSQTISIDTRSPNKEATTKIKFPQNKKKAAEPKNEHSKVLARNDKLQFRNPVLVKFSPKQNGALTEDSKADTEDLKSPISLAENKFQMQSQALRIYDCIKEPPLSSKQQRIAIEDQLENNKDTLPPPSRASDYNQFPSNTSHSTLPMDLARQTFSSVMPKTQNSKRSVPKSVSDYSEHRLIVSTIEDMKNEYLQGSHSLSRPAIEVDLSELVKTIHINNQQVQSRSSERQKFIAPPAESTQSNHKIISTLPPQYESNLINVFSYPSQVERVPDSVSFYGLTHSRQSTSNDPFRKTDRSTNELELSVTGVKFKGKSRDTKNQVSSHTKTE